MDLSLKVALQNLNHHKTINLHNESIGMLSWFHSIGVVQEWV